MQDVSDEYSIGPHYRTFLYKLLMLNMHKNVLEIGCYNGYSTLGFLQALQDGAQFQFTSCDIKPAPHVAAMVDPYGVLIRAPSAKVIRSDFDFIFVDGNHSLSVVAEEIKLLLQYQTKTILAHDTFLEGPIFDGAALLRLTFTAHRRYRSLHNNTLWKGTLGLSPGISLFTQDADFYEQAKKILAEIDVEKPLRIGKRVKF